MMWARVVELMLGVWLAASPFFLVETGDGGFALINALVCGAVVVTASCLAYWPPTRHARALNAVIGVWLAGASYLRAPHPAPPMFQNEFLVGLLLIMFAIVPNEATQPPRSWRRYVRAPAGDAKTAP